MSDPVSKLVPLTELVAMRLTIDQVRNPIVVWSEDVEEMRARVTKERNHELDLATRMLNHWIDGNPQEPLD